MMLLLACVLDATETGDTVKADSGGAEDSADTGETPTGDGLLTWVGDAAVAGGWDGVEDATFRGDLGLGDVLCDVRYTVVSTGTRDDCEPCEWAYDVVLGEPEVVVADECEAAGYTADVIASIAGTTRAFGLARDYVGHSDVLLYDDGTRWDAAAFADWNDTTSSIAYTWDRGYLSY